MRKTYTLDCARLSERGSAQAYLKAALKLPDGYGENLDALHDVLTERGGVTVRVKGAESAAGYAAQILRVLRDSAAENPGLTLVFR